MNVNPSSSTVVQAGAANLPAVCQSSPPPAAPPPPPVPVPVPPQLMPSSSPATAPAAATASAGVSVDASGKKVRKPYTITKSRESWTDEEHDKFLEALQLFDRDWKKIEDFVGSKTVIQIRSHAQKYFLKVQKNGTIAHVPPPRPKRKASHPYPQKASKNVLIPLTESMAFPSTMSALAPGYTNWDETPMQSQDEFANLHVADADIGSKGLSLLSNNSINGRATSAGTISTSEIPKQEKQNPALHGIPDFAEVYGFIGSVFDPDTTGHIQKLKDMDPINFETVLLLMRNLTVNLSSPDFEPIRKVLSSNDLNVQTVGVAAQNSITDISC